VGADHAGHGHGHGLAGHRELSRAASRRRLGLALGLTLVGLVAEIAGGLLSHSLALLADAGHLFSDAAALGLSAVASVVASRKASATRTYGYHRAEILAALVNGAALIAIAILVVKEAVGRLAHPEPVRAGLLLAVAAFGLLLNLACLGILAPARESGLNARAAFLHVVSDALGSVGAIAAGACAWAFGWMRADAVASILIAGLVAWSAWNLVREAVAVLMEGAPAHLDVDAVQAAMAGAEGVTEIHDLHVWSITSGLESLSAHVVIAAGRSHSEILARLRALLAGRFGIHHVTLQIEDDCCDVEEH
jgi:cobalt-zinc-cadmium efflux system protein